MKFAKAEINELSVLVQKCYGTELNVFLLQGMLYSCLSAATEVNPTTLFFDPTNKFKPQESFRDEAEFMRMGSLMIEGMYRKCYEMVQKYDNLIPMVSIDKFRGKYFEFDQLNDEQQRNLLDWYVGYFWVYHVHWDHQRIQNHLKHSDLMIEEQTVLDFYVDSLHAQHLLAQQLVKKFQPNYSNTEFNLVAKYLLDFPQKFDADYTEYLLDGPVKIANSLLMAMFVNNMMAFDSAKHVDSFVANDVTVH
jgi:hypothetical protein